MSLLQIKDVTYSFGKERLFGMARRQTPVLSNISLQLEAGSCLGLLGGSGAGKSTLGKIILGLAKPQQGQVLFEGMDLFNLKNEDRKRLRREIQVVFQDCYSAVNPRMTAAQIIGEPLDNFESMTSNERSRSIAEALEMVGLSAEDQGKYPRQFSGGQLQRINIARAIVLRPKLIVLDESVSSLDTVNQVHIIRLLRELKEQYGTSYLFITHDIKAAFALSDQLAVLDKGVLVGCFDSQESLMASTNSHVQQLLQSALASHPRERKIRAAKHETERSL
ncbi:nickel import ATP-binding protein NikE [Paenibacillus sp. L3-i20]|uniref:nickel import ATP-binding protein NikE n=1 Tax=Paenibacillus sp. L3-i20 TaxID=2905833 RepID=UPI001EDE86E5|nr:nickel import ATP-binding protein NikE [Paenibacillus sp. L3-i20]